MTRLTEEHMKLVERRSLLLGQFSSGGCNPPQRYALTQEIRRRRTEVTKLEGYLQAIWDATPESSKETSLYEDRVDRFVRVKDAYEAECELVVALEEAIWNQCRLKVS